MEHQIVASGGKGGNRRKCDRCPCDPRLVEESGWQSARRAHVARDSGTGRRRMDSCGDRNGEGSFEGEFQSGKSWGTPRQFS